MEQTETTSELACFERDLAYAKDLVETWSVGRVQSILEPILETTKHETQPEILYLRLQALMTMGKTLILFGLLTPPEKEPCFRRARSFYKAAERTLSHLSDLPVEERERFDLDHSPEASILFIDFELRKDSQTGPSQQRLSQKAGIQLQAINNVVA